MSFVKNFLASELLAGMLCSYVGVSQNVAASGDSSLAFERRYDERSNNDDRRMDFECKNDENDSGNSDNSDNYNNRGYVESKIEKKLFVRGKKVSEKSRLVASILAFFGGPFGLNHFYAGNTGTGVLYLLTGGLFGIGSLVSFFKTVFGYYEDSEGNVVYNWI